MIVVLAYTPSRPIMHAPVYFVLLLQVWLRLTWARGISTYHHGFHTELVHTELEVTDDSV